MLNKIALFYSDGVGDIVKNQIISEVKNTRFENKIDLILLDIMMPKVDGYKVIQFLQNSESTKDIPVIFITSKTDEESIVKGYKMGARDYVTKPYKKMELLARIKTQLEINKLIIDLKFLANHDTMTGIYNRRYWSYESTRSDNYFVTITYI